MRVISVRGVSIGVMLQMIAATSWAIMPQPDPMPDPGRTFQGSDFSRPGQTNSKLKAPKVKKKVPPVYAAEVAALGVEGVVEVAVWVDSNGRGKNPRVVRSDNALLNPAAMDAVKLWEYKPGSLNGTPTDDEITVEVTFSLSRKDQEAAAASLPAKSPVRPVYQVAPDYPADAELVALAGEVMVEFVVSEAGEVQDPRVVKTTHSVFNTAAINAIKQWGFLPARAEGHPKATRLQVPFVFKQPPNPLKQSGLIAQHRSSRQPEQSAPPPDTDTEDSRRKQWAGAVYPFEELLKNKQATIEATVEQDPEGRITAVRWHGDVAPPFQLAIEAMLDTKAPEQLSRMPQQIVRWEFNPYNGDVRINNAGAAILKQLRLGGGEAVFVKEDALDQPPVLVARIEPVFPTRLAPTVQRGEATIEFFVAENGRVLLPRIVSASAPEFGYAASQAVTGWQFMFPRLNGETTVALLQRKFEFNQTTDDDLPGETVSIGAFNQPTGPAKNEVDAAPVADKLVRPDYPRKLRDEGIRGTVILSFIVTPKGEVVNPRVENQTQQAFAEAALEALNQSTFKPGNKDGRPVHTRMQLVVHFTDPLNQSMGIYEMPANFRES